MSVLFKSGVVLTGTSLLGWVINFFTITDEATMSRVLIWYLALGGAGAVLMLLGRYAGGRSI